MTRPVALRAFTLIELLVVIGVIILLTVGGAIALGGRGSEGMALASSQSLLAGLVGSARAQAALHQVPARVVVYANVPPAANADANKYLRTLQVVRAELNATGAVSFWVAVGDPITLPAPICVVPPSPVPTNHLRTGVSWNNNATTGPVSTLSVLTGFAYRGQAAAAATQYFGANGQSGRVLYLQFEPDGTVSSNTSTNPTKIALTTAILTGNALPQFNNASGVRGLFVRRSGAISMVDDATSF